MEGENKASLILGWVKDVQREGALRTSGKISDRWSLKGWNYVVWINFWGLDKKKYLEE